MKSPEQIADEAAGECGKWITNGDSRSFETSAQKIILSAIHEAAKPLVEAITEHILEMDKLMVGPSSYVRGQKIAQTIGQLQTALSHFQPKESK